MDPEDRPDWESDLSGYIRQRVRAGFLPLEEILSRAGEYLDDLLQDEDFHGFEMAPEETLRAAERILAEEVSALAAEQATWARPTDNERLDRAFAALEASGILARQDWTCCQSCGHREMEDELLAAEQRGEQVRGYTFYHAQDTESAINDGGMHLAYAAVDDALTLDIGEQVCRALRAEGLDVRWSGDRRSRISVGLRWQRTR